MLNQFYVGIISKTDCENLDNKPIQQKIENWNYYFQLPQDFLFVQTAQYVVLVAYERFIAMCRYCEYQTKINPGFRMKVLILTILISTSVTVLAWIDGYISTSETVFYVANFQILQKKLSHSKNLKKISLF